MFKNGYFVSGRLGKSSLRDSKEGLIYKLIKIIGHERASLFIFHLAKLSATQIESFGFSFGIEDVTPNESLVNYNSKVVNESIQETNDLISNCTDKEELEGKISQLLSQTRDKIGTYLI